MKGESFVKLPRELLESAAWRTLGINARRLIDFLMVEHLRRGGRHNGWLLAPRRQLEEFGIGARHVSAAIDDVIQAGLVDCRRGVGRQPSVYALTWLPLADGAPPSNRWRVVTSLLSNNDFPREVTKPVATSLGKSQGPKTRVSEGKHLSRYSIPGERNGWGAA